MTRRVVITGAGAVSALGATPEALWQGLLANRSGVRRLPRFVDAGLEVTTGGDVEVAAEAEDVDRDTALARRAVTDALRAAGREAPACGLFWGTGLDTFQLGGRLRSAGAFFQELASGFDAPRRMVAVACASGSQTLGEACDQVRRGRVAACVAGGSSVMLTPFYLIGFARLGALAVDREGDDPAAVCRPFDRGRRGMALADGAAAVVIEPLDAARRRGASPLAEVLGWGTSQDAFDLNRPPEDGAGAHLAMTRALDDAGLEPRDVDAVNTHGTGTFAGDAAEAAAIRRLFGERWREVPVHSIKGATGHAMSAAGTLEAIVSCFTCATGVVPPTVNLRAPDEACALDHVIGAPRDAGARRVLSVSLGMGGQNAAVVLGRVGA